MPQHMRWSLRISESSKKGRNYVNEERKQNLEAGTKPRHNDGSINTFGYVMQICPAYLARGFIQANTMQDITEPLARLLSLDLTSVTFISNAPLATTIFQETSLITDQVWLEELA
jgi:hypothetical protein